MKGVFELNWCVWLFCLSHVIKASPISQEPESNGYLDTRSAALRKVDITKACIYKDNVYQPGDEVPQENPCDSCKCTPPGISCSTQSCPPKKPWCKTIQKANKCCPEYVCHCEMDGLRYEHNEKMVVPDPCKVCYCRGGEMECATVTCYSRTDCVPVHVEGKCCPKYDHCPLQEKKEKIGFPGQNETDFSINNISSIEPNVTFYDNVDLNETTEVQMTPTTISLDFKSTNSQTGNEFSNSTTDSINPTVEIEVDYGEESDLKSEPSNLVKNVMAYEGSLSDNETTTTTIHLKMGNESYASTTAVDLESTTQFPFCETTTSEDSPETQRNLVSEDWKNVEVVTEGNLEKNNSTEGGNGTTLSKLEELVAPGLKMLSAEQMEFLHLGEEPPVYVDPPASVTEKEAKKGSESDVVVVPETTPITVEMTKVTENKT